MAKAKAPTTFNVIARAPFHVYYQGPAEILSAKNKVGPFDILPGHADFFSMLEPGDITIATPDSEVKFAITTGLLTVQGGDVMLFVNM